MINALLRARHWRIFLAIVVAPLGLYVAIFSTALSNALAESPALTENDEYGGTEGAMMMAAFGEIARWGAMSGIVVLAALLSWYYAIVKGLRPLAPPELRPRPGSFAMAVGGVAVALAGYVWAFTEFFRDAIHQPELQTSAILALAAMAAMALLLLGAGLYCIIYTARVLVLAETRRRPRATELLEVGILLWLYPLGIWLLQPRINALLAEPPRLPPRG